MTTTQSKTVSSDEIQSAAILLIAKNGSTTSLEVKNFLRSQGFTVYQNEVSQACIELQENNDSKITYHDNGSYRTYSKKVEVAVVNNTAGILAPTTNSSVTVSDSVPALAQSTNTQSATSGRVKVNITPINANVNSYSANQLNQEFDKNDWIVFASNMNTPVSVYDSGETRDHIRTHYARVNSISMSDVRSKRVANFTK